MKRSIKQTMEKTKLAILLSKVKHVKSEKLACVLAIQTEALAALHDFMHRRRFTQLMPVVVAPMTDPLCHGVHDIEIDCDSQKLKLTKSMILHKFMALMSDHLSHVYIMSPCVRLEPKACKDSGRHLLEFTQLDMETKDLQKEGFMSLIEELVGYVVARVKKKCDCALRLLERELIVPKRPFKVFKSADLKARYGKDYEKIMSEKLKEPFWITGFKREFYDREDADYDLVWPEGFGEAMSGGQRHYKYGDLVRIMRDRGYDEKQFGAYLELARRGLLKPTCGGGIGIERMVRFLTGLPHIRDVGPFTKVPGEDIVL